MFIYLVALTATLFIIFGLLNTSGLNDWLQLPIRCSLYLYNGLIRRPMIEASLQNELLENDLPSERPVTVTSEWQESKDIPSAFINLERLPEAILEEPRFKLKTSNLPYSFETMSPDEKDKDLGLPVARTLQLGTTKDNAISTSKQEGKENIFESLKNTLDKATVNQSARLSTKQIYDLLLKETTKENESKGNEAKQKLLDNQKNKFNESLTETRSHLPSSSKNTLEHKDNAK